MAVKYIPYVHGQIPLGLFRPEERNELIDIGTYRRQAKPTAS